MFKLKNLDGSINASTMNGHPLKPYFTLAISEETSSEIFSVQTTISEVNWIDKKTMN